jgi:transcriptional regulator with XRE-family HTH domain
MSITIAQIRGARGILNWSQQDLSQRTGISATSIGSIENGLTTPRASTLETIRSTFERNEIEFIGLDGVRTRNNFTRTLNGSQGFSDFLDDVFETAVEFGTPQKPTQVFLSNVVHDNWIKWMGKERWANHVKRMTDHQNVMDVRIIVQHGDLSFPAKGYSKYKWFPKEYFNDKSFYSYHDRLAFLNFKEDDVQIIIIQQPDFADGYRRLFLAAWEHICVDPDEKLLPKVKSV